MAKHQFVRESLLRSNRGTGLYCRAQTEAVSPVL